MSNFGSFSDLSSLFTKLSQSLGKRPKTWTGTRADWDQMTAEQKAVYDGWYVNFTDDAEEGGGGAGGGHIIEDSEGTELTQRDTLQVGGSLIAEDDSTNEKTIITDGMQTIDWEDWLEMTDEEKAAVPKALITNVPGLDSKLNVQFMNKLWENPNPTSAFAAQNITLSSDDYDFLLIEAKRIKSDTSYFSEIVEKGKSIYLSASFGQSGGATNYFRVITYSSDTSLYVDNGYKVTGATASTSDNDCVIPYKIYGFKASVDVDITAYMADLSTDAKNVYLESGESVEDAINRGSVSVTADGVKTYSQIFNELYSLINASKITKDTKFIIDMANSTIVIFELTSYNSSVYNFINSAVGNTTTSMSTAVVKGSSSEYKGVAITSSSVNFNDASNTVSTSGFKFIIKY